MGCFVGNIFDVRQTRFEEKFNSFIACVEINESIIKRKCSRVYLKVASFKMIKGKLASVSIIITGDTAYH